MERAQTALRKEEGRVPNIPELQRGLGLITIEENLPKVPSGKGGEHHLKHETNEGKEM